MIKDQMSEVGWNYQTLAARTIPTDSNEESCLLHAAFGIVAETYEAYDAYIDTAIYDSVDILYPKADEAYQHFYRELGDISWMCAEIWTVKGSSMQASFEKIIENANAFLQMPIPAPCLESQAFDNLEKNAAEVATIFQHRYQGRVIDFDELKRVLQDILTNVSLLACFAMTKQGQTDITPLAALDAVLQTNIVKLRKRYPGAGWELERDINREEGDT